MSTVCVICKRPRYGGRIWTCGETCALALDKLAVTAIPSQFDEPLQTALRARWRRHVHAQLDALLASQRAKTPG